LFIIDAGVLKAQSVTNIEINFCPLTVCHCNVEIIVNIAQRGFEPISVRAYGSGMLKMAQK
jgi:hypothetical protein